LLLDGNSLVTQQVNQNDTKHLAIVCSKTGLSSARIKQVAALHVETTPVSSPSPPVEVTLEDTRDSSAAKSSDSNGNFGENVGYLVNMV